MRREPREEAAERTGFAAIDPFIEAAPARLAQTDDGVVRGAVADEPYSFAIGLEHLREVVEFVFEIENRSNDCVRPDGVETTGNRW